MQAEEKKAVIQWEGYSNVKRLMNTVSHVQQFFTKNQLATHVVSVEERERAKVILFNKSLKQEQFGEVMKSLKVEKSSKQAKSYNLCYF